MVESFETLRDAIQELIFDSLHDPGVLSEDRRKLTRAMDDAHRAHPDTITTEWCVTLQSDVNSAIGLRETNESNFRAALGNLTNTLEWLRIKGREPSEEVSSSPVEKMSTPTDYLMSWPEILSAVGRQNNEQNKNLVRRLNQAHDGPIILPAKGGQPKAVKVELLKWWNSLEQTFKEGQQDKRAKERDKNATTEAQYNYGSTGTVLPDIAGEIKSRRSK